MDDPDYAALVERYRALPDEELLHLFERRAELQPLAQVALDQEASTRRGRIEAARRIRTENQESDAEWQVHDIRVRREREFRRARWGLYIVGPLLVILFVMDPLGTSKALALQLAIAAGVFGLWWLGFWIWRRYLAKKSGDMPGDA